MTIRSGAGGVDAADFAEMLMRMYTRWAERNKYSVEVYDVSYAEEAGIKSAEFAIHAPYAYGTLSVEAGTHRLVRISPFDNQGRRQTSFAAVEVVPVLEQTDEIEVDENDVRVDVFRSGGPGGQSVNTTDSAVRLTHIPTGIVVSCQNEKSQLQNKASAMVVLKAKLLALKKAEEAALKKDLKGDVQASWGDQMRNYVLNPYQIVKDLRTGYEVRQPAGRVRRRPRRLPRGRHPLAPRRREGRRLTRATPGQSRARVERVGHVLAPRPSAMRPVRTVDGDDARPGRRSRRTRGRPGRRRRPCRTSPGARRWASVLDLHPGVGAARRAREHRARCFAAPGRLVGVAGDARTSRRAVSRRPTPCSMPARHLRSRGTAVFGLREADPRRRGLPSADGPRRGRSSGKSEGSWPCRDRPRRRRPSMPDWVQPSRSPAIEASAHLLGGRPRRPRRCRFDQLELGTVGADPRRSAVAEPHVGVRLGIGDIDLVAHLHAVERRTSSWSPHVFGAGEESPGPDRRRRRRRA